MKEENREAKSLKLQEESYLEVDQANKILMNVFEETGKTGKSLYEILQEHEKNS